MFSIFNLEISFFISVQSNSTLFIFAQSLSLSSSQNNFTDEDVITEGALSSAQFLSNCWPPSRIYGASLEVWFSNLTSLPFGVIIFKFVLSIAYPPTCLSISNPDGLMFSVRVISLSWVTHIFRRQSFLPFALHLSAMIIEL